MPRRKLKSRVRQIIISVGDDSTIFNLDSNEEFETPKIIRDQILSRFRLKLSGSCPPSNDLNSSPQNSQTSFQNPIIQINPSQKDDEKKSSSSHSNQIQTKNNENNQISSVLQELFDNIPDDEWMNIYP